MPPTAPNVSSEVLRTLHRIHHQLTDLRERLDRGPKRIKAAEAAVAHREKELAAAREELKRLRAAADQKQLQFKAGEDKIRELKRKLNAAQNNREYQALKDQIAADQMAHSVLEDEIYEALERVDQFQPQIAERETVLAGAKQRADEVRKEVGQEEPRLSGDLTRLEGELKTAEATLPADIAEFYQRGVRQKGEDALASIENNVCGGCHQTVPLNILSQVLLGRPTFCKTCGRLLYIPESAAR